MTAWPVVPEAALGDKVSVLPVAAEEGVEVIVDVGFQRLAAFGRSGAFLRGEIFLARFRRPVGFDQVAVGVQGVVA